MFSTAAVVCAVLFVVLSIAFATGFWVGCDLIWLHGGSLLSLSSERGSVAFAIMISGGNVRFSHLGGLGFHLERCQPLPLLFQFGYPSTGWHRCGMAWQGWRSGGGAWIKQIVLPVWLLQLATGGVVARWCVLLFGRWRYENRQLGLCPRCGYDVRATPERCSECGTVLVANVGPRKSPFSAA
jgi:hypothetical protein